MRRQRRPQLPHRGRHVGVRPKFLAVDHCLLLTGRHGLEIAGEEPDDPHGGSAVEERQDAVDGIESLVTGDAAGEWVADHAPEQLGDVGVVPRRAKRHEHLGARAVPAGRDGVLGDEDAHVRLVLHALRLDPINFPCSESLCGVIAEHMPHRRNAQLGIFGEDRVERDADVVRVRRVRCLQHQERLDGLDQPLRSRVVGPSVRGVFQLAGGAAHEDRVEVASLVRDVENEGVLDQPGLLDPYRVDDDRRQGAPVSGRLGLLHRRLKMSDGRRYAPHDRDGRTCLRSIDEPTHDGRLFGSRLGVEATVRLVQHEV